MNDQKLNCFVEEVEKDWIWRQRELTSFKQVLAQAEDYQKATMTRAGLLLLYAHWEGFIKTISQDFLKHFVNEDIKCVPRYVITTHLARIHDSNKQTKTLIDTADQCLACLSEGAKICPTIHKFITTGSNLDFDSLKKIATSVGANFTEFETREQDINRSFVSVRHDIAHGERRPITHEEFLQREQMVTTWMDTFKKNIIDSAEYANRFLKSDKRQISLETFG